MADDVEELRAKLKGHRNTFGSYRAFALAAELSESWLYKFVEERIEEPRKRNLNKVREQLAKLEAGGE